jgi:hypothetical protein
MEELKENIHRGNPAEQLQRVNQNIFRWCDEYLCVEGSILNTCDL